MRRDLESLLGSVYSEIVEKGGSNIQSLCSHLVSHSDGEFSAGDASDVTSLSGVSNTEKMGKLLDIVYKGSDTLLAALLTYYVQKPKSALWELINKKMIAKGYSLDTENVKIIS